MRPRLLPLLLLSVCVRAEVQSLTLRQALDLAMKQSPEILLSRLEEQKAAQRVRIAKDPFVPKVFAGSGLAYSNGFPMSIEGSAPSVLQARAVASVYNLSQKYALAQAREESRTATLDGQSRREDAFFRTVELFLDAERKAKMAAMARRQVESAAQVEEVVRLRVNEGRELPLELKRAQLESAKTKQRADALDADVADAEGSLAMVLGMASGDRARAVVEERAGPALPETLEAAVDLALKENAEIRRLESALLAKSLAVKSHEAERWPKLDLVAQYGLLARFNNYEDFFRKFQRHNVQLGVSVQMPLVLGPAPDAQARIVDAEAARLRLEVNQTRSRITLDTQRAFQDVRRAESARQVARLDLEVSRDSLSVLMARMEEGRASLQQVEQGRLEENLKWLAYYDAQYQFDRARYALLNQTGGLMAALSR